MSAESQNERIAELDGVRGLAALLVVYVHVLHRWMPSSPEPVFWLRTFSHLGWTGVHLFFVLSGFLIGGILMRNRGATNYFQAFYLRRSLRILPLYAALVAACFVLQWIAAAPYESLTQGQGVPLWSYPLLVQNFFMATSGSWGPAFLSVTWSVAVEEQFYLLLPLLIFFCPPKRLPWLLVVLIASGPLFRAIVDWPAPGFMLPGVFESLGGGTLLAWLFGNHRPIFQSSICFLAALAAAAICAGGMVADILGYKWGNLFGTLVAFFWLGFFWLVLALLGSKWAAPLRLHPLRWIGSVSYGIYLLHMPIQHAVFLALTEHDVGDYQGEFGLALATLSLLLTGLLAWASFTFMEKPLIRLGHRHQFQTTPRDAEKTA